MSFAALETAVNGACAAAMTNATVTSLAAPVAVVFRERLQGAGIGLMPGGSRREYMIEAPLADWPAPLPARGDSLTLDYRGVSADYMVGQIDTDPTGWTTVVASRA